MAINYVKSADMEVFPAGKRKNKPELGKSKKTSYKFRKGGAFKCKYSRIYALDFKMV